MGHVLLLLVEIAALGGAAWLIYAWAGGALAAQLDQSKVDPQVRWNLVRWANPVLAVLLVACVAGTFGVHVLPIALGAAVGLGVLGLAALPAIRSLASGFVLRTVGPFRPGDRVTIAGITGTVADSGPFGTTLMLVDGSTAFVAHDQAMASPVVTAARAGARIEVALAVPPGPMSAIEARIVPLGGRFEARDGRLYAVVSSQVGEESVEAVTSRLAVQLEGALRG